MKSKSLNALQSCLILCEIPSRTNVLLTTTTTYILELVGIEHLCQMNFSWRVTTICKIKQLHNWLSLNLCTIGTIYLGNVVDNFVRNGSLLFSLFSNLLLCEFPTLRRGFPGTDYSQSGRDKCLARWSHHSLLSRNSQAKKENRRHSKDICCCCCYHFLLTYISKLPDRMLILTM